MKLPLLSILTLSLINCSSDTATVAIKKPKVNDSTILFSHNQLEPEKERHPLIMTIELDTIFFSSRPNRGMINDTTETFSISINLLNQTTRKITYTDHTCSFTDNFSLNELSDFYIVKAICYSNAIIPVSLEPNDTKTYSIQIQRKKITTEETNKVSLSFNCSEQYGHSNIQKHIVWSNEIEITNDFENQ